jgi:flavin reductase (DIM6/NTAB) family NADH-FMN oxidoreductase RutF
MSPAGLSDREFRDAISLLATGVTIVTTQTERGPAGMTASAVCSLSLEPVQLLVCISKALPTHTALEHSGSFAVNVLGEDHTALARRFATPDADRFAGLPLREGCRLPVLQQAIAYFECSVNERFEGGDHSIFTGRVETCGHAAASRPLLYFGRTFGSLETPEAAVLKAWAEGGATV